MSLRDAWRVLFGTEPAPAGGSPAVDPDEVRKAFLQGARRCHPDLARSVGQDEASLTARFQRLQAAYTAMLAHLEAPAEADPPSRPAPPRGGAPDGWGPSGVSMSGAHWIGPVPAKPLRFGRFLYYTGRISRESLGDALSWQRSQRPPFGSLAVDLGLLGQLELGAILDARRMGERIGRTAVRLGLLSPEMRDWIVSQQQRSQRPLGVYFLERGMLSERELGAALREQELHNHRAGSAHRPGDPTDRA